MLAPDFIDAIPEHLRDDLYFQLKEWYFGKERLKYMANNKEAAEKARQAEIMRARRLAILKKYKSKPQKFR